MSFELPTADQKRDYVLKQFDRIALKYDLANDLISFGMHRLWKERALKALQIKKGGKYLDVCCGTGDLALKLADKVGPGGSVVGLDFSPKMLNTARARSSARTAVSNLEWLEGDAQNLPFADAIFDGAIISFGLRNLTDLQKGLCEMARVVKPGGIVVNLDLGHPTAPFFTPLYFTFFQHVVPLIGQVIQHDRTAYTYLPSSLQAYPKPEGITAMFKAANLSDVVHEPLAVGSVALHRGTVT